MMTKMMMVTPFLIGLPLVLLARVLYLSIPSIRRRRIRRALRGKHVWVTGGSQGLGFSIALCAFRAGARVTLTSRSPRRLADAAGAIDSSVLYVAADVGADRATLRAAFAQVEEGHGPVDVVVANAGINHAGRPFIALDDDEIEAVLATNLLGVVRTFACALPAMLSRRDGVLCAVEGRGYHALSEPRGGTHRHGGRRILCSPRLCGHTSHCRSRPCKAVPDVRRPRGGDCSRRNCPASAPCRLSMDYGKRGPPLFQSIAEPAV
jgi:3-dehydrosphinganine reductase